MASAIRIKLSNAAGEESLTIQNPSPSDITLLGSAIRLLIETPNDISWSAGDISTITPASDGDNEGEGLDAVLIVRRWLAEEA